jgi:hypothetical protein
MKSKLFTLAAAFMLAAVLGGVYAAPALAAVIKAALIKNVDEPGRTPYSVQLNCNDNISTSCTSPAVPAIPPGKRLVVEYVGVEVFAFSGPGVAEIFLTSGLSNIKTVLHVEPNVVTAPNFIYSSDGPVRVYFEAGEVPTLNVSTISGGMNARAWVTGYLVDLTI